LHTWINFYVFLFWLSFLGFFLNLGNFFKLVIYAELVWLILFVYSALCGGINDDLGILSFSFFVLGFAGVEFSLGLLLIVLYKNTFKTADLDNQTFKKSDNNHEKKKVYINRKRWDIKL